MKRNNLKIDDGIDKTMSVHEHDGHTAVLVAIDSKTIKLLELTSYLCLIYR